MNILVLAESGFLNDYCLQQSTHSEYLLHQVETGSITMVIPEYAFAEADGSLQARLSQRQHQLQEMLAFLNQLIRSQDLEPIARRIKVDVQDIQNRIGEDADTVKIELMRIKQVCHIIPLKSETYHRGKLRSVSSTPPPDEIDCIIFESIKSYLQKHRQTYDLKVFLCHDKQHFDRPEIHQELDALDAQIVFSSGECLRFIQESLPSA